MGRRGETYKLFKAIHSLRGTTPYQQLPPQLGWSQSRMPPILRFWRGLAEVAAVRRRVRVVVRRVYIVGVFVELLFGCCWFEALDGLTVQMKIELCR